MVACIGLGHSYRARSFENKIQTATEHYETALNIAKDREDETNKTKAYILLGEAYIEFDNIQKIIEDCEKVVAIVREQENKKKEHWEMMQGLQVSRVKTRVTVNYDLEQRF